jgi:hypothetical protein
MDMPSRTAPTHASAPSHSPDPIYRVCQEPARTGARLLIVRWREHAAKGDIVIGRDIPSHAFARLLSHMMIVEPITDVTDGLIRLAGTSVRSRYGCEVSGKHLSDLYSPTALQQHLAHLREVRDAGEPLVLEATVPRNEALPLVFDEIILRALAPDLVSMWNVVGVFVRSE